MQTSAPPAPMNEAERRSFWKALLVGPSPLPAAVEKRLRAAAWHYANGGTWEQGMGLPPDTRRPATRLARAERVNALVDALRALDMPAAASNWRRADALASAIVEFEQRDWPAWKDTGAPAEATALRRALYRARRAGKAPLPASTKQVHELLTAARALT